MILGVGLPDHVHYLEHMDIHVPCAAAGKNSSVEGKIGDNLATTLIFKHTRIFDLANVVDLKPTQSEI